MGVTLNPMKGYRKKQNAECGTDVRYDIRQLLAVPETLQQWLEERQNKTGPINPQDKHHQQTVTEIWKTYKTLYIRGSKRHITSETQTKRKTPQGHMNTNSGEQKKNRRTWGKNEKQTGTTIKNRTR